MLSRQPWAAPEAARGYPSATARLKHGKVEKWKSGKCFVPYSSIYDRYTVPSFNSNFAGCSRCRRRHRRSFRGGSGIARWDCCRSRKRDSRGGGGGGGRVDRRPEQSTDMEVSRGLSSKMPFLVILCFPLQPATRNVPLNTPHQSRADPAWQFFGLHLYLGICSTACTPPLVLVMFESTSVVRTDVEACDDKS